MKWVLLHQSSDNHQWLLQDSALPAKFTFNRQHHSIRIKGKSTRLFFLEVAGFFNKKIVLRSEYGVIIGEAMWNQPLREAALLMNEQKYFFEWNDNQLSFFDKNKALLSSVSIDHADELERTEQFALVFSLAWVVDTAIPLKKTEDLLVA